MSYNISQQESEICQEWTVNQIFKKTLDKNKNNKKFTFYDGPPFATGNPHYGHILAGSIKDTICRHAQFNGYDVERRAGWDTHGLPVEYEIEKELGIKNHQEIIDYGLKNYNDACRSIVLRCAEYWKQFMTRFGRWIDFDNDYKTMDFDFMQSVWSVFKEMWDNNLIYQGFRVMPYSTACGTPLSNFEANSNYKQVNEESVIVKFKSKNHDFSYLVWTTTPWSLPSNMVLCVNPSYTYSVYELNGEKFLVCETLVSQVFGEGKKKTVPKELNKLKSFTGSELEGDEYEPIFNFYENIVHKVVTDDYVKDSSGTGIVHIAPAFGEDDFRICVSKSVITSHGDGMRCPVDRNGCFTEPLTENFIGRNVKECDKDLIDLMKNDKSLFKRINTSHQYPYCWRSDTPLIYKAVPSWFVEVTKIKDDMLENCEKTNWVPEHVKSKRFHNWLADAKDWGISRNRFWGTPMPIWTDGEEFICIGSASELESLAGLEKGSIKDIHRENVDDIVIISSKTGNILKRVEFVFDCWFESGSMPYASQNYHLNKEVKFPADFIAEGLDQTRGWFYTLLIIGTALKNEAPFKNVIVNGLVLAEDGKKMSKRLKNYPDPQLVVDKYGSDALRLYLISSPAVKAEGLRFKESDVENIIRTVHIPLLNSYSFYNEHKTKMEKLSGNKVNFDLEISENIFDKWIVYKFNKYKEGIINDLNSYTLHRLHHRTCDFIDNLNNMYLKLNRDRLKGKVDDKNYFDSQKTLGQVLFNFSLLSTSYLPYFSEILFNKLKNDFSNVVESVHLLSYDDMTLPLIEYQLEFTKIDCLIEVIDLIRTFRGKKAINSSIFFNDIKICSPDNKYENLLKEFESYIINESNVFSVGYDFIKKYSKITYSPNLALIGKKYKKDSGKVKNYIQTLSDEEIMTKLEDNNFDFDLTKDEFNINREIQNIISYETEISEDNQILIYVNTEQNDITNKKSIAKILATKIQKMRKEVGLRPWNNILINISSDSKDVLDAYLENSDYIFDIIRYPVFVNNDKMLTGTFSSNVDILDYKVRIVITKIDDISLESC
jgi:isoleucyl-tRNA synthetase